MSTPPIATACGRQSRATASRARIRAKCGDDVTSGGSSDASASRSRTGGDFTAGHESGSSSHQSSAPSIAGVEKYPAQGGSKTGT